MNWCDIINIGSDNNGITIEDFYELCQTIGFDEQTTELLKNGFKNKGLIIDSYKIDLKNYIVLFLYK